MLYTFDLPPENGSKVYVRSGTQNRGCLRRGFWAANGTSRSRSSAVHRGLQLHPYGKGFASCPRRPFFYFWTSFTPSLPLLAKNSDKRRRVAIRDSGTLQGVIQVKVKIFGRKVRNKWGMVHQGNILLLKHLHFFQRNGERY